MVRVSRLLITTVSACLLALGTAGCHSASKLGGSWTGEWESSASHADKPSLCAGSTVFVEGKQQKDALASGRVETTHDGAVDRGAFDLQSWSGGRNLLRLSDDAGHATALYMVKLEGVRLTMLDRDGTTPACKLEKK